MKVLFGSGNIGRMALHYFGHDNVRLFVDNYADYNEIEGITVVRFNEYMENRNDEDEFVITVWGDGGGNNAIKQLLNSHDIVYTCYDDIPVDNSIPAKTMRVHGVFPDIRIEISDKDFASLLRPYLTREMFRRMFQKYKYDFEGLNIDAFIYVGDKPDDAYKMLEKNNLKVIFAYSSTSAYRNKVIAIPDFRCFYEKSPYFFAEDLDSSKKSKNTIIDSNKIFWRGTLESNDARKWLSVISEEFPEVLKVECFTGKSSDYVPMTSHTHYKYFLDIRGIGYTDRVTNFLWLGRPIFIVDRPYVQWYHSLLKPMEHYIPVKEDLSNLLQQYDFMEDHQERWFLIQNKMTEFAEKYISPEGTLGYLKDTILEYGVV